MCMYTCLCEYSACVIFLYCNSILGMMALEQHQLLFYLVEHPCTEHSCTELRASYIAAAFLSSSKLCRILYTLLLLANNYIITGFMFALYFICYCSIMCCLVTNKL